MNKYIFYSIFLYSSGLLIAMDPTATDPRNKPLATLAIGFASMGKNYQLSLGDPRLELLSMHHTYTTSPGYRMQASSLEKIEGEKVILNGEVDLNNADRFDPLRASFSSTPEVGPFVEAINQIIKDTKQNILHFRLSGKVGHQNSHTINLCFALNRNNIEKFGSTTESSGSSFNLLSYKIIIPISLVSMVALAAIYFNFFASGK